MVVVRSKETGRVVARLNTVARAIEFMAARNERLGREDTYIETLNERETAQNV